MAFGLILGPILEENVRRSLIVSRGDWFVFVDRPISLFLLVLSVAALAWPVAAPYLKAGVRRLRSSPADIHSESSPP